MNLQNNSNFQEFYFNNFCKQHKMKWSKLLKQNIIMQTRKSFKFKRNKKNLM